MVPSAYVPDSGGTMHAALVAVGGTTTTTDQMHFVVLYAAPLAAVDAAQDTVMFYLLFGVPILIVVVGRGHLLLRQAARCARSRRSARRWRR